MTRGCRQQLSGLAVFSVEKKLNPVFDSEMQEGQGRAARRSDSEAGQDELEGPGFPDKETSTIRRNRLEDP